MLRWGRCPRARRITSLFSRSSGFVDQISAQWARGKVAKERTSTRASSIKTPILGKRSASCTDLDRGGGDGVGVGWAKMVRDTAATMS